MKISYTIRLDEHQHMTSECEVDHWDMYEVHKDLEKVVEFHRLKALERKREADAAAIEDLKERESEPRTEPEDFGVHERVWEYDGAFKCLECGGEWGALPGRPTIPKLCVKQYIEAL